MKIKHVIALALIGIGAIALFHLYQSHGGVSGVKQGLGFGGMGNG